MPWSKAVLSKELAEKSVLDFVPVKFNLGTPEQAGSYFSEKKRGSDFRMNETVRMQTGVDKVEKISEEEKIEAGALEKLKDVQEDAYAKAYELGLIEGRKEAFTVVSAEIAEKMTDFDQVILQIKDLKKELSTFNESHLVRLVFEMASRLAKTKLENNNEAMIEIIRDAVGLAQDEENITVRVSANQFEFMEELKKETGREFEFTKKIRFEPGADIVDGGCIVETNYGEVDARLEQRVAQLWATLSENIPKVKDKVAS